MYVFSSIVVLTAAFVAVIMDLFLGRVKNWWIYLLWVVGASYQVFVGGFWGAGQFLLGSMMPIVLLFPLFRFRMLGPGDIKLFSALGGVMKAKAVGVCILSSFLCGGTLSLGILLLWGNFDSRLRYFTEYIQNMNNSKKQNPYYIPGERPENIHFTVAVLMGVLLYAGGLY